MKKNSPTFTPILTQTINDSTMPAGLFRSFVRLYAAGWRQGYRQTEALQFESQLLPLLGLSRTQARQHLRQLRFAKLLDWTCDGRQRYMFTFNSDPPGAQSGLADTVVVNGFNNLKDNDSNQQQYTQAGKSDPAEQSRREGQSSGAEPGSATDALPSVGARPGPMPGVHGEVYQTTARYLARAGVWTNAALRIAGQIERNQMQRSSGLQTSGLQAPGSQAAGARPGSEVEPGLEIKPGSETEPGQDVEALFELPGVGDVLGWIAYCFADREKNKIGQPAAMLAANLNANRPCPDEYLPPRVCTHCGSVEDHCTCEGQPPYVYPEKFLEGAFRARYGYEVYKHPIWGTCRLCRGFPCQCEG